MQLKIDSFFQLTETWTCTIILINYQVKWH